MIFGFGNVSEDFDCKTAPSCIGERIKKIREAREMTRAELGALVGLDQNRVQQYENGKRKPKIPLLEKFAVALGVESNALLDPQAASYIGAMFVFYEMETLYDLRLKEVDGQMCICFGESQKDINVSTMNKNLKAWYKRRNQMEADMLNAKNKEERKEIIHKYHMWEWNFSRSEVE